MRRWTPWSAAPRALLRKLRRTPTSEARRALVRLRLTRTPAESDRGQSSEPGERLLPDGGEDAGADDAQDDGDESDTGAGEAGAERSNVEVTDAGEAEPVDPKWQKPDIGDIPEVDGPKTRPAEGSDAGGVADPGAPGGHAGGSSGTHDDSTAGMPNNARSPGQSRLKEGGADGYVVALELCARLPDDVRLPEEAADLVPVALEAELEQDVQSFAAEEFDNPAPHVETLDFVDVDDELWLRLRLGVRPEAFSDLDPEEIRDHALQQIDGLL